MLDEWFSKSLKDKTCLIISFQICLNDDIKITLDFGLLDLFDEIAL